MNFIIKPDINILEKYRKELDKIHQFCRTNKTLNGYQIERLNYFLDRAINYCDTRKVIKYEITKYRKDYLLVANSKQVEEYKNIYRMLIDVKNQIINDKQLKQKYRNQLIRNLTYVQGHLLGKIYRGRPS